ncbi:MAG: DUF3108 domain-containing protein [Candidatus Kapabacteria bacterium]|nr:DUF3108 domain-containing protein [Ignavibacteriota bacterium]MCW5883367.1 DUF3108 domain-containing protein [Candidatus Kapabacteria bacterium]
MKNIKFILVLFIAFLSVYSYSYTQSKVVHLGEYIEYDVSFFGVKLGKIIIESESYVDFKGKKVFKAKSEMKSNPGIPFVSLHAFFDSWMDTRLTNSYEFVGSTKGDEGVWEKETFYMNYDKNIITYEKRVDDKVTETKPMPFDKKVVDGAALFFFARQFTDIKKTVKVPTVIGNSISYTHLNFHGTKSQITVPAIKYPVKTLYFDGRAEWEGIYGLKGHFKGWFSDDEARVPIKASMNVYVGNVDIELVKWSRGDWQPPKAN